LGLEVWNELKYHYLNSEVVKVARKIARITAGVELEESESKASKAAKVSNAAASNVEPVAASNAKRRLRSPVAKPKAMPKEMRTAQSAKSKVIEVYDDDSDASSHRSGDERDSDEEPPHRRRSPSRPRKDHDREERQTQQPSESKRDRQKKTIVLKPRPKKMSKESEGAIPEKPDNEKEDATQDQEKEDVMPDDVSKESEKEGATPEELHKKDATQDEKVSKESEEKEVDESLPKYPPWTPWRGTGSEKSEELPWPPPKRWKMGDAERWGPGDWACTECGNHNFKWRGYCQAHRCGFPRDSDFKVGDWYCSCGNRNYSSRLQCNGNRCSLPRAGNEQFPKS
jgi:hypothetical protein